MDKQNKNTKSFSTKDIIETGILIALVLIATKFINIRLPFSINGGLVHLGTGMLFISSIGFGAKKGAISGAFGMGLFDILSGWAAWAPFTFVVRGGMGFILGKISWLNDKRGGSLIYNIVAVIISTIFMIVGYYFTEVILYGNWVQPTTSIPGNFLQSVVGCIIALPIIKSIKKFDI